jgi:hypothetical protein
MDEYSKSGARSYEADSKRRAKEIEALMREALALPSEADFVEFLRTRLRVAPGHPRYLDSIMAWRSLHS